MKYHFYFVFSCLAFGSNFILMDRAGLALGPVEIAFGRLAGGCLVIALWWWATSHRAIARRYWPHVAFVGFLGNALPFAIQPLLIAHGVDHSFFGMMMAFVPLLTLLCSVPMLGIWPRWRETVGVLGGFAALAMLMWDGQSRGMSLGALAAAFSVPLAYAVSNTYIRQKLSDVPPVPLTTGIVLTGALWLLPLLVVPGLLELLGIAGPSEPTRWTTALGSVALMAIFGTGVGIVMFISMLHARGPLYAGMVTYAVPLVALAWGAYDHEMITLRTLTAIGVVLAMVALVQSEKVSTPRVIPSEEPSTGETADPQLVRST